MTPEERNLITELFDRLASLENAQRDPAAEQVIYDGFQRAPNAAYALVQTVLQSYSPPEFRGRTTALFHMGQVVLTVGSMLVGTLAGQHHLEA